MFIFQVNKTTEATETPSPFRTTSVVTGGDIQKKSIVNFKQGNVTVELDRKTNHVIANKDGKTIEGDYTDKKFQDQLKTFLGTEIFDSFRKWADEKIKEYQIEQKKSQSKPKGTPTAVAQYNKKKLAENVDGTTKEGEKEKGSAPKSKSPREEQAEQVQKQKPPEEKKDAPATDFFTKPKQD